MRRVAAGSASFLVDDDKDTFWDKVEAGAWEPETLAALAALATAGTQVVDIGAWVGPITLLCAAQGAEVVAYEPDPRAFALLSRNVAANPALQGRIRIVERAVAGEAGAIRLGSPRKQGDSMGSILMADRVAATWEALAVRPAAIAAEIAGATRVVLKVDVEGAEYALAEHLAPLIGPRLEACVMAFHPRLLAGAGADAAEIDARTQLAQSAFAGFSGRCLDGSPGTASIPRDRNSTMLFTRS